VQQEVHVCLSETCNRKTLQLLVAQQGVGIGFGSLQNPCDLHSVPSLLQSVLDLSATELSDRFRI
jgi:hypothetical protein